MRVLGIEAATPLAGAAIVEDGRLLAQTVLDVHRAPAERLLAQVARVLEDSGTASPAALDLIAVSAGPGSFTGIRVGLATALGLAAGSARPVAGVPTLAVLAAPAAAAGAPILALLDARRGEVYYALFCGWTPAGPGWLAGPGAARPESLGERLAGEMPAGAVTVVGSGAALARDALERFRPGRFVYPGGPADAPQPGWTAVLGSKLVASGAPCPAEPIYIRRSDAEEAHHGRDRR